MQQLSDVEFHQHKPIPTSLLSGKRVHSAEKSVGYGCQCCNDTRSGFSMGPDFYTNATRYYDYSVHDLASALGNLDMAAGAKKSCLRPTLSM